MSIRKRCGDANWRASAVMWSWLPASGSWSWSGTAPDLHREGRDAYAIRPTPALNVIMVVLGIGLGEAASARHSCVGRGMGRDGGPPKGTVTFVFTDIEGSTLLLQHLGERYDSVLQDHNLLLRTAWDAHDGYEVKTEGDAFFVAFADPVNALSAAVDAQRALATHLWPDDVRVRVRIGIHTGDARVYDNDYVGLAVHEAARVASAAHGGQIIASAATTQDVEISGVPFVDLGLHRLKDLPAPMRLFQVAYPGGEQIFPPVRTLTVMPNNFPAELTTFIGRENETSEIQDALRTSRLVTLTGAGGVGKTRLALHVGAELLEAFPDGAWLVDLSATADPAMVPGAVATALGLREQPGRTFEETIVDHVLIKRLLILLDNCEHVIEVCARIVHLVLTSCPSATILATSREALNVPGEVAWRLPSLQFPESGTRVDISHAARSEAVRLFVQRASAVRPGFELTADNVAHVSQICRRLDGMPLAIELAAARMRSMSAADIAERLDDRFRLLTGGSRLGLARQRTLEATVSWSYELLAEDERTVFDRLSVFSAGWTSEAAQAVCSDETISADAVAEVLTQLVDRSMVVFEETDDGRTRYRLLETLRQFGRERLIGSGAVVDVRQRHLAWTVEFASRIKPQTGQLATPEEAAEEGNFVAALEWAFETEDHESAQRLLGDAWFGHFSERESWLRRALANVEGVPIDVAAKANFAAGALAFMTGNWSWGVETMHAAAEGCAAVGDHMRTAMSLVYEASCLWGMAQMTRVRELIELGIAHARAHSVPVPEARGLMMVAWLDSENDIAAADARVQEFEDVAARMDGVFEIGHAKEVLGFIRFLKGELPSAALTLAEACRVFLDIQHNCASHVLETAAAVAVGLGRLELAAEFEGAADRIRDETADQPRPWERAVREVWLPKIATSLVPDAYSAARERGRSMDFAAALTYAADKLEQSA